jgi:hypothetical protein
MSGGAEISKSFVCSKFSIFAPEGLEITLFRNGCLAFISLANSDLCLKLKSSVMSASFQTWPGDLETAANSTSLLPIGFQTPVVSIEKSGGRSTWLWGKPFLTATAVRLFFSGSGQSDESDNLE